MRPFQNKESFSRSPSSRTTGPVSSISCRSEAMPALLETRKGVPADAAAKASIPNSGELSFSGSKRTEVCFMKSCKSAVLFMTPKRNVISFFFSGCSLLIRSNTSFHSSLSPGCTPRSKNSILICFYNRILATR